MPQISYPQQLRNLASADPDRPAISCGLDTYSRSDLEARSTSLAVALAELGVGFGDFVTIVLPNSIDWFVSVVAIWKLGAVPQPLSPQLAERELVSLVELADAAAVIGVSPERLPNRACVPEVPHGPIEEQPLLPDAMSPAWKAPSSGGSTGRPKLIVSGDPAAIDPEESPPLLLSRDGCLVMPGPLYHNGPMAWSCHALLAGNHVVVLAKFDPETVLAEIEARKADMVYLVPTMMKRIWQLPESVRLKFDLSSLRYVWHLAEPCPAWLKKAWIDWLGPEKIMELYGGTEGQLITIISGSRWLERPGSVGRAINGEIMICGEDGVALESGACGEVWLRTFRAAPAYHYVGAEARQRDGGWESLGDLGWLDQDGYLYLTDRMQDMVVTSGVNVYPAEVEAAISEHPLVMSCAVIGLADDLYGNRVHAIVQVEERTRLSQEDLLEFLNDRLARYKFPRSVEFVDYPLRDDAGKVRRVELRSEREV
jgi:bile acid-coenzyme A ligase